MLHGRLYKNIVTVENETQALVLGAKEGAGYTEAWMQVQRPMRIVIQKNRTWLKALIMSAQYSKMGLFNMFIQSDTWSD